MSWPADEVEFNLILDKFEKLSRAFAREYSFLPNSIKQTIAPTTSKNEWGKMLFSIPVCFTIIKSGAGFSYDNPRETKPLRCNLNLYTPHDSEIACLSIMPRRGRIKRIFDKRPEHICVEQVNLVNSHTLKRWEGPFHEFVSLIEESFSFGKEKRIRLAGGYIELMLRKAYLDLQTNIIDYFRRAESIATEDEKEHWSLKRDFQEVGERLQDIERRCEESRGTIGSSKFIGNLRISIETTRQYYPRKSMNELLFWVLQPFGAGDKA